MRVLDKIRLRLRSLLRRHTVERELEDELRFHLDQLVEENIAAGMAPDRARQSAMLAIGGMTQFQEQCRDMRRVNFFDDLIRDLRYAGRSVRRSPGFAVLAVLIMALGIGANTAVFTIVNTVLLKPLAYRDPDRIVTLTNPPTTGEAPTRLNIRLISIPNFRDWHDRSSSFEAMAYHQTFEAAVVMGSGAEYAQTTKVSPEFFRVFGVEPIIGRAFTSEELKLGSHGTVMISYSFWQSHFGGDPAVLGRTLRAFGESLQVVGVLPPGFRFPENTDLWFPANTLAPEPTGESRAGNNYFAVGRLKPGVALRRAQAEMSTIAQNLARQYPDTNKGRTVAVTRMQDQMVIDVRLTLYLLLGAVSLVLLIACANTATLLLGKATARTREIAVRLSLGASRMRIVRQLVAESLLVAMAACAAGLLLAQWGSKALVALAPVDVPRLAETGLDAWVLIFTIGVSVATSLLFGIVPALYASKVDLNDALKQGGARSVIGGGMVRMRGALVVVEIALAVVLLSGAGLLVKSFVALQNVSLGFRPENVLVMKTTVPAPIPESTRFFNAVLPQIAASPGVTAAGATMVLPGHVLSMGPLFLDHLPPQREWISAPKAALSVIAPGTFAALGIPLKSGRDFNAGDALGKPMVAVVNQELVEKALPGQNPIGRKVFCMWDSSEALTIVGVVGNVRQRGPDSQPLPECYIPYQQHWFGSLHVVARTAGDPGAHVATLRRLVHDRSSEVSVKFTTLESDASEAVAAPRFRTWMFGVFAGLAMCLASVGVYGVMAYAIGQRSTEIGLRMALGASTGSVLRLVLRQGLALAGLGLALGLAAAAAGTRLLTTMLFRVRPNDPVVYLAVALLLGIVALAACYIPARRASRIDPLAAIRQE